jgi:hypothetical protein
MVGSGCLAREAHLDRRQLPSAYDVVRERDSVGCTTITGWNTRRREFLRSTGALADASPRPARSVAIVDVLRMSV